MSDLIDSPNSVASALSTDDSVERFAGDLRAVRSAHGNPTLGALAKRADASKSSFSSAFRGKRLPSEKTVRAIADVLDVEAQPWIERRESLANSRTRRRRKAPGADDQSVSAVGPEPSALPIPVGAAAPTATGGAGTDTTSLGGGAASAHPGEGSETTPAAGGPASTELTAGAGSHLGEKRTRQRWKLGLGAAVIALASAGVTSLVWMGNGSDPAPVPVEPVAQDNQFEAVTDGVDPLQTRCKDDGRAVASKKYDGGQFLVELFASEECGAVWGRVTRYDGGAIGSDLTMTVYPKGVDDPAELQRRSARNLQSVMTTMLIRDDSTTPICGAATVTPPGGQAIPLTPALCFTN